MWQEVNPIKVGSEKQEKEYGANSISNLKTNKYHLVHAISQIWEAVNTIFCYEPIFPFRGIVVI